MKLYSIPPAVAALLDAPDGELSEADLAALDSLEMELAAKAEAICRLVRNSEAEAAAYRAEAERLSRSAQVAASNAARLKEYLRFNLERMGLKSLDAGLFKVRVQANGGKQPIDAPSDPMLLPPQCRRTTVSVDLDVVRSLLESGAPVEGCRLLPRGSHLRVT